VPGYTGFRCETGGVKCDAKTKACPAKRGSRERKLTPYIGLVLKVIPFKLFYEMVPSSPADNVASRVK